MRIRRGDAWEVRALGCRRSVLVAWNSHWPPSARPPRHYCHAGRGGRGRLCPWRARREGALVQAASEHVPARGEMHTHPPRLPREFQTFVQSAGNHSPPCLFLEGMAGGLWGQEAGRGAAQPRSPALVGGAVPGSLANVLALASESRGCGQQPASPASRRCVFEGGGHSWLPLKMCFAARRGQPPFNTQRGLSLGRHRCRARPGGPRGSAPPAVRGGGSCSDPTGGTLARAVALLDGGGQGLAHGIPSLRLLVPALSFTTPDRSFTSASEGKDR